MSGLVGTEPLSVARAFLQAEHDRLEAAYREGIDTLDRAPGEDDPLLAAIQAEDWENPLVVAYDRAMYLSHRASRVKQALEILCEHPNAAKWDPEGVSADTTYAHRCPDCGKVDWHGPNLRWNSPSDDQRRMNEYRRKV